MSGWRHISALEAQQCLRPEADIAADRVGGRDSANSGHCRGDDLTSFSDPGAEWQRWLVTKMPAGYSLTCLVPGQAPRTMQQARALPK